MVEVVIPRGASEMIARKILYEANPVCVECTKPIYTIADAFAVSLPHGIWKLAHRGTCELQAMVSDALAGNVSGFPVIGRNRE
jgi:hypothetical protein